MKLGVCLVWTLCAFLASGQEPKAIALKPSASAQAERRVALVIGNDSYRNLRPLRNARSDARAVAQALEKAHFTVTLKLDQEEKGMKRALREFKDGLRGGEAVVVYYSGHGVQFGGANYLLPVDIQGESEDQIRDDAVAMQRILDDLKEHRSKFALAIIDACRDNPFPSSGKSLGTRGLAPTQAARGQMVLFAAGAGEQALDRLGPGDTHPNGLFTRVLLKQIAVPGLSVDRAMKEVREEVVRLAQGVRHEQTPALYDQSLGDFYFTPGPRANPSVPPAPEPIAQPGSAPPTELSRKMALVEMQVRIKALMDRDGPGLQARIKVTEEEARDYFRRHPERFKTQVFSARHILVAISGVAGVQGRSWDQAEARIRQVQAELASGKSFIAAAREYSDDPGSKDKGGLFENIAFGKFVPEFDQAVRTQRLGEVGGPVKSTFGYHLIKVEKLSPEVPQTFEAAKEAATTAATAERREQVMKVYMDAAKEAYGYREGADAVRAARSANLVDEASLSGDPVLALVAGEPVRTSEFELYLKVALDAKQQASLREHPAARDQHLTRFLEFKVLAAKAKADDLQ